MTRTEKSQRIAEIEQRAVAARLPVSKVCEEAQVLPQVWSRAKARGGAHPITLSKMSDALDRLEQAS